MRKFRSDKVLTAREESVVNSLRQEYGLTINEVAELFNTTKDVVRNADPARKMQKALYR